MSQQTVGSRVKNKNDTAANWASLNPVLLKGEMGIESDTGKFKFGDGATAWNSLGYAGSSLVTPLTLYGSSWSAGNYTISNNSITANSVITICPSSTMTVAQYDATAGAKIIESSISAGQVILKALGTVPPVDCPIVLVIEG